MKKKENIFKRIVLDFAYILKMLGVNVNSELPPEMRHNSLDEVIQFKIVGVKNDGIKNDYTPPPPQREVEVVTEYREEYHTPEPVKEEEEVFHHRQEHRDLETKNPDTVLERNEKTDNCKCNIF